MLRLCRLLIFIALSAFSGCSAYNAHPTLAETDCLSDSIVPEIDLTGIARPQFSADTRWISFVATVRNETCPGIYLAKLRYGTGSDAVRIVGIERPIRVTAAGLTGTGSAFSPDGLTLLLSVAAGGGDGRPTGKSQLFRIDGWEGALAMATPGTAIDLALPDHAITRGPGYHDDPCFSSDGKWVCFVSDRTGKPELFAMRFDGTGMLQLTSRQGQVAGPVFAPDGRSLIYAADRQTTGAWQVTSSAVSVDGHGDITSLGQEQDLSDDLFANTCPAWFPDNQHLAFSTTKDHGFTPQIFVMTRDGRNRTRVTFNDAADRSPTFSKDGTYLMWTRELAGQSQLRVAHFRFPAGS